MVRHPRQTELYHGADMKKSRLLFTIYALGLSPLPLEAQYIGAQFPGIAGLEAGTQPGPGYYVTIPLYYSLRSISLYDAQGDQIAKRLTGTINLFTLPAVQVVTPLKILGGNYGASFSQWIINGEVNVASTSFQRSTSYAYGDIYMQPFILGWHLSHFDVTAAYAFFAPTGGGTAGLHMWVNEEDFGLTYYPDAGKKWNLSTMAYYDYNRPKHTQDVQVGNVLTLAGGIGRHFLKGAGNAGVAYDAQWKTSNDTGSDIPPFLPITNGRAFAVGPDVTVPVFAKGRNVGLLSFHYEWIVGAKTSLGGQILNASFTFAHLGAQ